MRDVKDLRCLVWVIGRIKLLLIEIEKMLEELVWEGILEIYFWVC